MRAQLILDPSDLLKIARLVHDTPHEKNSEYKVSYCDCGITIDIKVIEDSSFGYCVEGIESWITDEHNQVFELVKSIGISGQIENVL